ncbi:MAG: UDP-N-acetylmuramoyl-tripeptide--D-alanyl-D-alanine ligase [Planctomycetota bacterium]|jgi:UDP-N-acetylmuramoyl-tripeptide--D-alanyl-D-alanine ligase
MSFFDSENIREVTGGRWVRRPDRRLILDGVGIDSRADLANRVFFAIKGERHDGHDYAGEAYRRAGARLMIVDRAPPDSDLPPEAGVLLVDDTRAALGRLASAYRGTLTETSVIAVTGSAGKTTVKGLIDAVLATSMRGSAAPGSYNNDIGVPLTVLRADPRDRYLVVEIGANRPGEIDRLAAMTRPDVGVITMIGRAHLEGFGSLPTIAREKAALVANLRSKRLAVVNADSPHLRDCLHPGGSIITFGRTEGADLRLSRWGTDENGGWFEVNRRRRFRLGLPGAHNAVNALAALAVGRQAGVVDERISDALARCRPVPMRMTRLEIGGTVVYNDAYNANPDSVQASLETFAELSAEAARRIIVLGDMLELGEAAPEMHREIGHRLIELDRRLRIDRVVLVGPLSAHTAETIRDRWGKEQLTVLADLDRGAAAAVARALGPGDAVLLKGSRAIGVERLIDAMGRRQDSHARPAAAARP